jgi:hypothetical protein
MVPLNEIDWAIEHARRQGEAEAAAAAGRRESAEAGVRDGLEAAFLLLLAASEDAYELDEATGHGHA